MFVISSLFERSTDRVLLPIPGTPANKIMIGLYFSSPSKTIYLSAKRLSIFSIADVIILISFFLEGVSEAELISFST